MLCYFVLKRDISHIIFLSLTIYIVYKPDLIDKVSRPKFYQRALSKKKKKKKKKKKFNCTRQNIHVKAEERPSVLPAVQGDQDDTTQ